MNDLTDLIAKYLPLALITIPSLMAYEFFKRRRIIAGFASIALVVVGFVMMFAQVNNQKINTLAEAIIQMEAPNDDDSLRVLSSPFTFVVEHPQEQHEILIDPPDSVSDRKVKMQFNDSQKVNYSIQLVSPTGKIIKTNMPVEVWCGKDRYGDKKINVDGKAFCFTPNEAGEFQLKVVADGFPFPKAHIYVSDPKKVNGKRMTGY